MSGRCQKPPQIKKFEVYGQTQRTLDLIMFALRPSMGSREIQGAPGVAESFV